MRDVSIGIDGYNFAMPQGTGIATYGLSLARTLRRAGYGVTGVFGLDSGGHGAARFIDALTRPERRPQRQRDSWRRRLDRTLERALPRSTLDAREVPLTAAFDAAPLGERLPAFDRLVSARDLFGIAHRHFARHGRFVRVRMVDPPAVMHWTYPVPVALAGARNIYTLHDVIPLKLPYATLDRKDRYRALLAACVARADHVCTVSETSRADIVAEFGVAPDRITNTYQIAAPPAAAAEPGDAGSSGLEPGGYFLSFGAIEPKKNIGRLIEAYLSLATRTPLVIVGGRTWLGDGETRLLNADNTMFGFPQSAGPHRVIRLDYLPRGDLRQLIRSARAVMFPSLYEGFGLPILEAMQLGTPVLTSDFGAMREIAGDAALLVDPYDVRAIAAGLRVLDGDPERRAAFGRAGLARAAAFSQERYIERLDAMYRQLLLSPVRDAR